MQDQTDYPVWFGCDGESPFRCVARALRGL